MTARTVLLGVALVVAAVVAYWPVTGAGFVMWDDHLFVRDNPAMNPPSWKMFAERWREAYVQMYTPVTSSYLQGLALVGGKKSARPDQVWEFDPVVFHAGIVLVHLLGVLATYAALRRASRDDRAAAAGAAVFAVHPLGVEAVAWVSGVEDVWGAMLTAAALWQWLAYRQAGTRGGRWGHFAAAGVAYALALLSKPSAVTVPLMALALDVWVVRAGWRRAVTSLAGWFAVVPVFVWFTRRVQPTETLGMFVTPVMDRPLVAADALVFYLGKLVWPARLAIDYGRTPEWLLAQSAGWKWGCVGIVIVVAAAVWGAGRRWPGVIAAAALFVAGCLPVLGLVPFNYQYYSTVADRYAYPSLIGVGLLVAVVVARVKGRAARRLAGALCAAAVVAMGAKTFVQAWTWENDYALFGHTLEVNPKSWMAWNNLGGAVLRDGNPREGLTLSSHALSMKPGQAEVELNVGTALGRLGRPAEALEHLRRAAVQRPKDTIPAMNLGGCLVELGRYREGLAWIRHAKRLHPDSYTVNRLLNWAVAEQEKAGRMGTTTRAATTRTTAATSATSR